MFFFLEGTYVQPVHHLSQQNQKSCWHNVYFYFLISFDNDYANLQVQNDSL